MPIRILLADDHRILRDGLHMLIEREKDLKVVGEADNGPGVVRLARELAPHIVLMDISMPDLNGIDATRQILADHPGIKVIALSMHSDRRLLEAMLRAGASGYVLKDSAFDELTRAIRTVRAGHVYLSPAIARTVVEQFKQHDASPAPSAFTVLSGREREVLQRLAEGLSTKEIAGKLFVSVKTIETHRRQIMAKLKLYTVADLTKYALREGLTSLV